MPALSCAVTVELGVGVETEVVDMENLACV